MSHKCKESGCTFHLPDGYPLPKCPWHTAPGRGPVKVAAALSIAAATLGGGIAYTKFRDWIENRKIKKKQDEWRHKATEMRGESNSSDSESDGHKKQA